MKITPLDIYQKEFKRVLRGVDPDEVEEFLERVADDYEQLIKENKALEEQVTALEVQLNTGERTEQSHASEGAIGEDASNTIREARKEADGLIREAMKEADNIVRRAKDEADKLRSEAEQNRDEDTHVEVDAEAKEFAEKAKAEQLELRREISRLRAQKEQFLLEYRELLEQHLKLLTEEI